MNDTGAFKLRKHRMRFGTIVIAGGAVAIALGWLATASMHTTAIKAETADTRIVHVEPSTLDTGVRHRQHRRSSLPPSSSPTPASLSVLATAATDTTPSDRLGERSGTKAASRGPRLRAKRKRPRQRERAAQPCNGRATDD